MLPINPTSSAFDPKQYVILNVDDDEAKRYSVTRILKSSGYTVIEAADGVSALKASESNPALIVLDIRLPDMSGYDVCRHMKLNPQTQSIPVLHLSASYVDNDHKALGLNLGADGYLTHPVAPNVLLATVKSLIRIRDAEARARESAVALENAYREQKRIAEMLQRSLLMNVREDSFEGMEIATVYEAAWDEASVGGDFYDVYRIAGGKLVLVVGDATGKGLSAATHTAEVKFALRAFVHEHQDPAVAMSLLNRFLFATYAKKRGTDSLVALALCIFDPESGHTVFSCAGMEPPFILKADSTVEAIDSGGLPVGAFEQTEFVNDAKTLGIGDTIIMTTDGIAEARRGRDFLSYDGMMDLVTRHLTGSRPLEESAKAVIDSAKEFANGQFQDDVCMLLAKRT